MATVVGIAAGVAGLGCALVGTSAAIAVLSTARRARRPLPIDAVPGPRAAIVVFGGLVFENGPAPLIANRIQHGLRLWRQGIAPVIVMTGGVSAGLDEVDVMIAYAEHYGVPAEALVAGRPGQNTREQVATIRRLADEGLGPFVVVSSSYHLFRIVDEARRLGLRVVPSAGPRESEERTSRLYLTRAATDAAAVVWYRLPTSLTSRVSTSHGTLRHTLPRLIGGQRPLPDWAVAEIAAREARGA